ncbi:MAG: hypothetical protein IKJ78_04305 [Bacteroidales bacterium]|nr:hypothetical protein [Bacteroidales bacterium]
MRKVTRLMACMVMGMAVMLAGCSKDENANSTSDGNGSDNETGEGIYLGIIGFNDQLYIKDISKLNQSTVSGFTGFINGLTSGNGTGLYFADYTALQKMHACAKPPKLKNVALVTFTDGLDNVSLANDALNPENYNSTAEYREALHNKIINDQVHGINVAAYTIGLKGNDVTDNALFMENLRKLASSDNNVFQVANMDEAMQRFREIAENLYSVSTSVNLGVNVPGGYDDGQVLRFTFDNASAATSSSRYIEATYRRSNGRTLESISYHGLAQGATSISSSSSQGTYYQFLFEDLKYADGTSISQADINNIMLWKKTSTGGWDRESEFDPASSSNITEDKSSALIMLVLDCTNSLGNDFSRMQQAGKSFVQTLANYGGGGDQPVAGSLAGTQWKHSESGYSSGYYYSYSETLNFYTASDGLYDYIDNEGDSETVQFSYTYNDGNGTITASGTTITFSISGNQLNLDGTVYTKQ